MKTSHCLFLVAMNFVAHAGKGVYLECLIGGLNRSLEIQGMTALSAYLNPLSPNNNICILLTILHIFLVLLVRGIGLKIKTLHLW